MSNLNDLKSVLAENGDYDHNKAAELKNNMVGTFAAMLRKVEQYYWVYTCLGSWLFVFALFSFLHSSNTKPLLFYGILMIVFFQTTILIKLWYWIANQRISVLKAIKQLELAGASPAAAASLPPDPIRPIEGLSRRERLIWRAALLTGCALIGSAMSVWFGGVIGPGGL
jgi:hypothetical protein